MTCEQQRRREHVEALLRRNAAAVDAAERTVRELRDAGERSERIARRARRDAALGRRAALRRTAVAIGAARRRARRAVLLGDLVYLVAIVVVLWLIFHLA